MRSMIAGFCCCCPACEPATCPGWLSCITISPVSKSNVEVIRKETARCDDCEGEELSEDAAAPEREPSSAARDRASARHKSIATRPKPKIGKIPNGEQTFLKAAIDEVKAAPPNPSCSSPA